MISIQDVINLHIQGSYLLQPQSSLSNPMPLLRDMDEESAKEYNGNLEIFKYLELSKNEESEYLAVGRTSLTLTKLIARQNNKSFGFEISWTKPPKINSICPEQVKSGIQRGDYIIFINNVNVVTKPKEEIIELIKMQKSCLRLEIFRPNDKVSVNQMLDTLASQDTPKTLTDRKLSVNQILDLQETPKSHKSKNFKQPKVFFQSTVGSGIFV